MSIPNLLAVVEHMRDRYPAQWRAAHRGGPDTEDFIRLLAWELHSKHDRRFGLNGKRGNPNDISDDAICFDGVSLSGDSDPTRGGAPVTVLDVIVAAGGPNPQPGWNVAERATPQPHAAWVQPSPIETGGGAQPKPEPTPEPQPAACACRAEDIAAIQSLVALIANDLAAVKETLGQVQDRAEIAAHESRQAAVRASEIKDALARGLRAELSGRIFGARVTLGGDVRSVEE